MEKKVLFDLLCKAGFTQDDAMQYFAEHEQYRSSVQTPLPLAYFDGEFFSILPYIDRENLDDLWGILLDKKHIVILKDWDKEENYSSSLRVAEACHLGENLVRLLPALNLSAEQLEQFNETVRHLRHNDVDADFLKGCYWTRSSRSDDRRKAGGCGMKIPETNPYTTAVLLCAETSACCREANKQLEKKVRLCVDL